MRLFHGRLLATAGAGAALLLGTGAALAAVQSDAEGCRDGDLARLPGFSINECDPAAPDHYVFAEGTRGQRDVRGTKVRIAYAFQEGATAPAPTAVLASYAAMFRQRGWTVAGSGDQRWIAAYRGANPAATQWAQVETNGGSNYQIVYVTGSGSPAPTVPKR